MVAAIRQHVTVGADGVIEIRAPELRRGTEAEVIVLVDSPPAEDDLTWAGFIGSGKGQFRSVEEVDAYIRGLRDEWDH